MIWAVFDGLLVLYLLSRRIWQRLCVLFIFLLCVWFLHCGLLDLLCSLPRACRRRGVGRSLGAPDGDVWAVTGCVFLAVKCAM